MSAPKIDMSKPHPRPRPFHNAAECGVCKGHHAPPVADQAAHQAHVQLEADRLLSNYRQQEADHQAHQAEEAHRDNVQAVTGVRPKSWQEVRAEQPPALRVLLDPGLDADKADVMAVRARAAADARTLDRRAAAAKLSNRRARLTRALAELPLDAIEAIAEFREQLAALDREAVAAGQEPEAMAALADALDPSPAVSAPVATHEPTTAPPKRDPVLTMLLGSE